MWGDRRRLFIDLSIEFLDEWDLEQLVEDASALAMEYRGRERVHVAASFAALASVASGELEERQTNSNNPEWVQASSWTVPVEFDPTSSAEHNKDDLGTVMAHAMAMAERAEISDDLAHLWFRIVRQLARERDRLRRERVIL